MNFGARAQFGFSVRLLRASDALCDFVAFKGLMADRVFPISLIGAC
jgi:hypothetical protein